MLLGLMMAAAAASPIAPSLHPIVRIWPGTAVLAGEVSLTGASNGKPFAAHTRFVDVWRLRAGTWKVVFTQATCIPAAH
ncbi:MAG TPA: nuclear transport factor 2 family protein [Sphingomicrobium sp.]|nr:nuclear transport factor 2 family protein [Sphingomicrobium sp.]